MHRNVAEATVEDPLEALLDLAESARRHLRQSGFVTAYGLLGGRIAAAIPPRGAPRGAPPQRRFRGYKPPPPVRVPLKKFVVPPPPVPPPLTGIVQAG